VPGYFCLQIYKEFEQGKGSGKREFPRGGKQGGAR